MGCIAYHPASLPREPDLAPSVAGLKLSSPSFAPLPSLKPHRIDPQAALDPTGAAILAVLNNPALEAAEAERDVAAAQLFATGLLPDPLLDMNRQHPLRGGDSVHKGSALSLEAMLTGLVGRRDRIRAAQAHLTRVDLDLLWKSWQVAARARWLVSAIVEERRLGAAGDAVWKAVGGMARARRNVENLATLAQRGTASAAEATELRSLVEKLAADLGLTRRRLSDDQESLRSLLGLAPDAPLPLRAGAPPVISPAAVASALGQLARRRPDLLALAAGFESADQHLRAAVAAQFPAVSVSLLRESDVEGVTSIGLGVSLRLPFFDGGRGAVRVAEASRAALERSYRARLDQTRGEVAALERDYAILRREGAHLPPQAKPGSDRAELAPLARLERGGHASQLEALRLALSRFEARQRRIEIDLELHKAAIALQTVLGVPPDELRRAREVPKS
ncbi:MAG TPA: TolC family protein [Thermoanaerobaculia bacterium]|nr:TolC family protein [Thermoanaerobaculia bacterium]